MRRLRPIWNRTGTPQPPGRTPLRGPGGADRIPLCRFARPRRDHAKRPRGRPALRSRLRAADVWHLARVGLTGRPLRALLSAVGIALGVATLVAVTGISSSSRAQLIAQIDALGTNMLTVAPGQSLSGAPGTLPAAAPAMVARIAPVQSAAAIGDVAANVYRNDRIPAVNTEAVTVYSAPTNLRRTLPERMDRRS